MPTKKPLLQAVVENETSEKFKYIAKNEKRKVSNMLAIVIEKYIEAYEAEHGEIRIPPQEGKEPAGGGKI